VLLGVVGVVATLGIRVSSSVALVALCLHIVVMTLLCIAGCVCVGAMSGVPRMYICIKIPHTHTVYLSLMLLLFHRPPPRLWYAALDPSTLLANLRAPYPDVDVAGSTFQVATA
jgi:hypothetical protein